MPTDCTPFLTAYRACSRAGADPTLWMYVERETDAIFRAAVRRLTTAIAADDLDEVVATCWPKILDRDRLRPTSAAVEAQLIRYLAMVAGSALADFYDVRGRRASIDIDAVADDLQLPAGSRESELVAEALDEMRACHHSLEAMLLEMRYINGLSEAEVARAVGVGTTEINNTLRKARRALMEAINRLLGRREGGDA